MRAISELLDRWLPGCQELHSPHCTGFSTHSFHSVICVGRTLCLCLYLCGFVESTAREFLMIHFPKCCLMTFIRPKLGKKAICPLFIFLQHHIYRTGGPPIGELVNMDEAAARCLSRCSIADSLEVFDILNLSWKSEKCHLMSPDMVTWTVLTMLTFPYQDWSDLPNR